ncbi:MAG: ASCH domain-containing protein [Sporomusaceae bacterium]|nr:ASCH domain-containing protein [Sporomusaceae bacterium]
MKAITILQPWTSLVTCGAKIYETRGWATKYRGPIAIHAAARELKLNKLDYDLSSRIARKLVVAGIDPYDLPRGVVLATADLTDCLRVVGKVSLKVGDEKRTAAVLEDGTNVVGDELAFGDFSIGRYAWRLKNLQQLVTPIHAKGQQRLWEWEGVAV